MAIEIERKFLVVTDGWQATVVRSSQIRDGLLMVENGSKARVRIRDEQATLTVKGRHWGPSRPEFEYKIPMADAFEMLRLLSPTRQLEKIRHWVPHDGMLWEIDVYQGALSGVVIAEIELRREDQPFTRPDWLGAEVTGDPQYRKINMLAARGAPVLPLP